MIKSGGEVTEEPSKMAELLNDHFYNCFNHNANPNLYSSVSNSHTGKVLKNITINFDTVSRVIRSPPNKCTEDLEGLSYALVKGGGDILSFQLSRVFILYTGISTESLPENWKKSVIYPMKKKSNSKTVNDYRPINITSVSSLYLHNP